MELDIDEPLLFLDFLPSMAQKLGADGLMQELAKGFHMLADPSTHTITVSSLRKNCHAHGFVLPAMSDDEILDMIRMGDYHVHGRHELDLFGFCVTMIRSSPGLMDQALHWSFNHQKSSLFEEEEEEGNDDDDDDSHGGMDATVDEKENENEGDPEKAVFEDDHI